MAKIEDFITVSGKTERVRHPCGYCNKALTSWYCLGCKGWFCMEPSYSNKGKKGSGPPREKELIPVQVAKKKNHYETKYFVKSCYFMKHEAAYDDGYCRETDENNQK